jgi:hypothetical protein
MVNPVASRRRSCRCRSASPQLRRRFPPVILLITKRSSTAPRKEGKVVVYSTTDAKLVNPLIKDFERRFPA